ncbi:hypothetical protein HOF67_02020 [Candidatus Peregrinibacteria bacterium]|jgi:hypothetical protein|nr:hypothetical protein [Candidatus Peregrinibacteria bacterium]
MKKDLLKLYRIIKSSSRVKEVRKMMGLKEGEYIITYSSGKGMVIGNTRNKKLRILRDVDGQKPIVFLTTKVKPFIEEKIIKYFDLSVDFELAEQSILEGRLPTKGFQISSDLNKKTGKANIKIELNEVLPPDNLEYLFEKIKQVNSLVKEFYRTENTKNLLTSDSSYKQIEPIAFLDEKFEIMKEYQKLRKKYPNKIPENLKKDLIEKTKRKLDIQKLYNAEGFHKTMSEFKKILG